MTSPTAYLRNKPEVMVHYSSNVIYLIDPAFQVKRIIERSMRATSKSDPAWLRELAGMSACILASLTLLVSFILPSTIVLGATIKASFTIYANYIITLMGLFAMATLVRTSQQLWRARYKWIPVSALGIGEDGLNVYHGSFAFPLNQSISWTSVRNIAIQVDSPIEEPEKKEPLLKVSTFDGQEVKLRLSAIRSIEERKFLVHAIKMFARRAINPEDLARMLRASDIQDIPFTQLWSEALRSSSPRNCSSVLPTSTLLQDGRFLIKHQIGGGGQGAIYLAEMLDEVDQKFEVALKEYVLPDQEHLFDRKRAIEQFEREVHLLARLKHPSLARLIDAFIEDHRAYLVLEYLKGQNLRELVHSSGRLSFDLTRSLAVQICDVLSYLHGLSPSVVHLDVSPENVVLLPDGSIRLIDFNTCSDGTGLRTKLIAGKQRYMPPEQYRNEITPQCDVYSLGCTLYFMLTGIEPEPLTSLHPKETVVTLDGRVNQLVSEATSLGLTTRTKTVELVKQQLLAISDTGEITGSP